MTQRSKDINQILAANLAYFMQKKGLRQQALASSAKVAQRTISNYLNPTKRQESKTGKPPSAKLTELQRLADALEVEPWLLLRDLGPKERDFYAKMERAYRELEVDEPSPQNQQASVDEAQSIVAAGKARRAPIQAPPSDHQTRTGAGLARSSSKRSGR